MDPKILDMIIKIGSSGGLLTVIAILLFVIYNQYNDLKTMQETIVVEKEKCQEHLLEQVEKSHEVLDRTITVIEKLQIEQEHGFSDLKEDIKELKDKK